VIFDCRPIYLEASLRGAGYGIIGLKLSGMMGLKVGTVVAEKPTTDYNPRYLIMVYLELLRLAQQC
jgi:hypothetical protein